MPLHLTGMVSRRALLDPEPPTIAPLPFEKVLKANPNHDPHSGRFTSGGGGRAGGTKGAPTQDAFGKPLNDRYHTQQTMDGGFAHGARSRNQKHFDASFNRGERSFPTGNDHPTTPAAGPSYAAHLKAKSPDLYVFDKHRGRWVTDVHTGSMAESGQPTERSSFS